MRIFGLLAIIVVLAIVMFQYKNNIQGTAYSEKESKVLKSDEVEKAVNDSVSDYQKKLEESLNQSE